jgi:hypothetical protein
MLLKTVCDALLFVLNSLLTPIPAQIRPISNKNQRAKPG